ncbi:MAG: DUF1376 domain-containing protein [Mesorhizobium sp.]
MTSEPIDVRCLPYMPLEIERLRKSKAWLRCKRRPELAFYLVNLWMRAWHEVPAGTIENDDDVLADAAMCSPEQWDQVKDDVLAGWKSKGDRLFHSTVTDIATVAASKLRKNKNRTEAAREALEKKRQADAESAVTDAVTDIATVAATEIVTSPEGKGRERKRTAVGISNEIPTGDTEPDSPLSPEEKFYASKQRWTDAGVPFGVLIKIGKLNGGDFGALLSIGDAAMKARDPSRYTGKILSDLKKENAPADKPDPGVPPWVHEARVVYGYPVEREGKYWRMAGALFDDDKIQVGN